MSSAQGKHILIFVGDDYEDLELQYPKYRLMEAGFTVVIAGQEAGKIYHGKHGYPQKAEVEVADLDANAFEGVVIPGGWMPDKLRRDPKVLGLVWEMDQAEKLVASICHGPWIDISAQVVKGFEYTSTPAIKDDLVNAGATWMDQPVVIDRHHVSSRRPDDLPEFMKGVLQVLARP